MTKKSKKILKYSLGALLCSLIFLCIFWPKLFVFYLNNVQKAQYLDVKPKIITYINNPDRIFTPLNIGLVEADLNLENIKKIKFSENLYLSVEYNDYYIRILPWQNLEGKEELYFSKYCEIVKTTTKDAKILNTPGVNLKVFTNLILKAIIMTSDQIEIINTSDLKLVSQLFVAKKHNKMMLNIYDPNNNYSQSIFIEPKNHQVDLYQKYSLFINSLTPSNIENSFNQIMEPLSSMLQKNVSTYGPIKLQHAIENNENYTTYCINYGTTRGQTGQPIELT